MDKKDKIFVTRPDTPDIRELMIELENIWQSGWLTNMGQYHNLLERKLAEYLDVDHISLFSNGTIALMTALKALDIEGEVITTPYSFVATAHSIVWNGFTPVFVDVLPENGNMDPDKIEKAITDKTSAIMPVHVYGIPCEVEKIQAIADKYDLKVIYDAAHAFGVKKDGVSILNYGDLSILSFHATKVFNTIEGGAIVIGKQSLPKLKIENGKWKINQSPITSHQSPDDNDSLKEKLDQLKNFGYDENDQINRIGINGKLNELQSAYGILNLREVNEHISRRKEITEYYNAEISKIKGIVVFNKVPDNVIYNYSYYPILVTEDYPVTRDELCERFIANNIFPRKYFYPLISSFEVYSKYISAGKENLRNAHKIAEQVLCLPLYPQLKKTEQNLIIDLIKDLR